MTLQMSGTSRLALLERAYLGKYVVLKKRADGSARAYFHVPARLRPSGWPASIPIGRKFVLPPRVLDFSDEAFEAVSKAGREIYAKFEQARRGTVAAPKRSLITAIAAWKASTAWRALTDKTREGYGYSIKKIQAWSTLLGHPDPTSLTRASCEMFLAEFNDCPTTKRQTLKALRLVMDQVIALGWRTDNPCTKISVKVPKAEVVVWEQADVDLYVEAARSVGKESIALIILLEWEIGQRLTDVRQFRPGAEYDPTRGVFSFRQQKTAAPVIVEVSAGLREMLNGAADGALLLFRNERTGKAYTENRLSQTFRWVRTAALKLGGRYLVLRQLRHSCVVQLARAGCTVPEIASITGHALGSVHSILSAYLPRDSTVARNAQVKRGLVKAERTGLFALRLPWVSPAAPEQFAAAPC
ncbi:MAG TPA: hypothetical protein VN018_07845 [Brevundimonas sp.]|nr:hypothetical protein [Brevundimonas sp.]